MKIHNNGLLNILTYLCGLALILRLTPTLELWFGYCGCTPHKADHGVFFGVSLLKSEFTDCRQQRRRTAR